MTDSYIVEDLESVWYDPIGDYLVINADIAYGCDYAFEHFVYLGFL